MLETCVDSSGEWFDYAHAVKALESVWVGYLNDFIWRTTKADADKEGPPSLAPTHPNNGDAIGAT